ncbi:MAG: alpha-amylase [Firmicutes bacterium]|nr:alpha-amylase [Bacillota bacterium]
MNNGVMLQTFEWFSPADGSFYRTLAEQANDLASKGITAVWMPPAAKGTSDQDVGYGNYDYWDVGEFDQKGTVRTKYGTREELTRCIAALHTQNISVYADMVFNHKGGADATETFQAVEVDPDDRTRDIGEARDIDGWTAFTFPGRGGRYSGFTWHYVHFNGVDTDAKTGAHGIFRILGENKYWSSDTDTESGNFDYLMAANIDYAHPDVAEELTRVCDFMIDTFGYDGFRYDALKHISRGLIDRLSLYVLQKHPAFYLVGEYWKYDEGTINYYLEQTDYRIQLFDVPLHFRLREASNNAEFDLRTVFDGTLVAEHPQKAVTFVDNHDSQPGQALESFVEPWFKEIAYALILLRQDGYPCVFQGDYTGYGDGSFDGIPAQLDALLTARQQYAWGDQTEYFQAPQLIGWVRHGDETHPHKLAVVISTGDAATLTMAVGPQHAGKPYRDVSGKNEPVVIDGEGNGAFTVAPGAVTYWTDAQA